MCCRPAIRTRKRRFWSGLRPSLGRSSPMDLTKMFCETALSFAISSIRLPPSPWRRSRPKEPTSSSWRTFRGEEQHRHSTAREQERGSDFKLSVVTCFKWQLFMKLQVPGSCPQVWCPWWGNIPDSGLVWATEHPSSYSMLVLFGKNRKYKQQTTSSYCCGSGSSSPLPWKSIQDYTQKTANNCFGAKK